MTVTCALLWIIFSLSEAAITSTPNSISECNSMSTNLKWAYEESNILVVEWNFNGNLMLQYIPSQAPPTDLQYSSGYTSAKVGHISNGEINISSLTTSDSGSYSCKTTYSMGSPLTFETQMTLTVSDMISTNLTCSYNQSTGSIDCSVIPSSITSVTINGQNHLTSSLPINGTGSNTYTVCMAGEASNCRNDGIQQCITVEGESSPTSTTEDRSTDSTNEQTTSLHRLSTFASRSMERTDDNTAESMPPTSSLHEQFMGTPQTTSMPDSDNGDKHLVLITFVLTFSFCGTLCLVTIIIIFRVVCRIYFRGSEDEAKASNTKRHISSNENLNQTKINDSQVYYREADKIIVEMTQSEPIWKRNDTQLKCKTMYQRHDPCNVHLSVCNRAYDDEYNGQTLPSSHSHQLEADLKDYVFYRGKNLK